LQEFLDIYFHAVFINSLVYLIQLLLQDALEFWLCIRLFKVHFPISFNIGHL